MRRFVYVSSGSKTVLTAPKHHFRSTPINGHRQTCPVGPVRAMNGSRGPYSITSSARAISVGGMWMPKDRAVAELITKLNSVGC
jgi:hypothetical protein